MSLVEAVPNFSEGRRADVVAAIAAAVRAVPGTRVLDVDWGATVHRSVITLAGPPDALVEALLRTVATAVELIDMRHHRGAHPRIGAADVVPLIPIEGISAEACVRLAHGLARRIGTELDLPVYLYGEAALRPERRALQAVRRGQYEALRDRLATAAGRPDFGPAQFRDRSGAVAVGVRGPMVAYNVNLATDDAALARRSAAQIRTSGRIERAPDGTRRRLPGRFADVMATGWSVPERGGAQVTMNLLAPHTTPPHVVYEAIRELARNHGSDVAGSEAVGLVPLACLRAAGRHFGAPADATDRELVARAIRGLGLDRVRPFDPDAKVLEWALERAFGRPFAPV